MGLTLAEQFKNAVAPLQNKSDTLDYRMTAVQVIPIFESVWKAVDNDPQEKTALARVFLDTLVEEARTLTQHSTVTGQGRSETLCMMMADHMDRADISAALPAAELVTALKRLQGYGAHFNGHAKRATYSFERKRYSAANNICQDIADRLGIMARRQNL